MSKGKFGVFAVLVMVLAPCAFNDPGLESGAGAAVAEETHDGHSEPLEAAGSVEGSEGESTIADESADAADGDFEPSVPNADED